MHAKIGAWLPYALYNPDACKNSGLKCPLKPGEEALYHASVDIKSIYPAVSVFHLKIFITASLKITF